jgi:hypothetical protein
VSIPGDWEIGNAGGGRGGRRSQEMWEKCEKSFAQRTLDPNTQSCKQSRPGIIGGDRARDCAGDRLALGELGWWVVPCRVRVGVDVRMGNEVKVIIPASCWSAGGGSNDV